MTDGYYRLGAIACFREEDIAALAAKQRVTGRTGPVGSALDTTTILGVYNPPTTRIGFELVMTETRLVVFPCRGAWCESAVGWTTTIHETTTDGDERHEGTRVRDRSARGRERRARAGVHEGERARAHELDRARATSIKHERKFDVPALTAELPSANATSCEACECKCWRPVCR